MLDIGNYYVFKPPFSKSEYFVKVTKVKGDGDSGNQYVYYDHVLSDMSGDCERKHFESGATHLSVEKLRRIISNLTKEIEDLQQKKENFEELLDTIESESNDEELNRLTENTTENNSKVRETIES